MTPSYGQQGTPKRVPEQADLLGTYGGFELYYEYSPQARFSARAMSYIYVANADTGDVVFTQVSAVHHRKLGDFTQDEIERRLAVDAVSRARRRIDDDAFDTGQIYTIEMNARDVE